jgi:arabinose-5-phosphate isomerase
MSFIAGKFAASLRSIGTDAHFLDSTHLAHGDLGTIRDGSFVFVFSKSGNSSELKTVIPSFRHRSNKVILITNNDRSPLASSSDFILRLQIEEEGDELNILPLASTLSAMALADAIVAVLAKQRGFSSAQFGTFHPAGQIGANLNRKLADVSAWRTRKPFVRRDASVSEAMKAIGAYLCGLACVVDADNHLIGVVSDGDLRRALMNSEVDVHGSLDSCMNHDPIVIDASSSFEEAYQLMEASERKLAAVPVVSGSLCLGVMLVHDLF